LWFKVGRVSDFEEVDFVYKEIGKARLIIGKKGSHFFAFDSRCPHKGGPLQEGILKGLTIKCPWHGYEFNILSGEPTRIPFSAAYGNWRKTGNLSLHKVRIMSEVVFVDI